MDILVSHSLRFTLPVITEISRTNNKYLGRVNTFSQPKRSDCLAKPLIVSKVGILQLREEGKCVRLVREKFNFACHGMEFNKVGNAVKVLIKNNFKRLEKCFETVVCNLIFYKERRMSYKFKGNEYLTSGDVVKDLGDLGVTLNRLSSWRHKANANGVHLGPPFLKVLGKVLYPKEAYEFWKADMFSDLVTPQGE